MDAMIPANNKLRGVCNLLGQDDGIKLPQIVAIGEQSAGKSSVIEGLVKRDFLPRGPDIVTRSPLELYLQHVPLGDGLRKASGTASQDWAVFDHEPTKLYTDFDEVRAEIERKTNELNEGSYKKISATPIALRIYSDRVVNLSLVDLPGIVKNPVGDQPKDIEAQTIDIVRQYISNENSIILAVSPATQDIAASESLKIARKVDKEGTRTLAVLTKLDMMDKGTDATDTLLGRKYPVKLGIVGVVGRSKEDTDRGVSIKDCLEKEKDFLLDKYPQLASTNGIEYLSTWLNRELLGRIKTYLPTLKTQIDHKRRKYADELDAFKAVVTDERSAVYKFITEFVDCYHATMWETAESLNVKQLSCGARIDSIIHDELSSDLRSVDFTGPQGPFGPVTERAFLVEHQRQVTKMVQPCMTCIAKVHTQMEDNIVYCIHQLKGIQLYPNLKTALAENAGKLLEALKAGTEKFVRRVLSMQKSLISLQNADIRQGLNDTQGMQLTDDDGLASDNVSRTSIPVENGVHTNGTTETRDRQPISRRIMDRARIIQKLLEKYRPIQQEAIEDQVPKAIVTSLIEQFIGPKVRVDRRDRWNDEEDLLEVLIRELYGQDEEKLKALLDEAPDHAKKRDEIAAKLATFTEAQEIVAEIQAMSI